MRLSFLRAACVVDEPLAVARGLAEGSLLLPSLIGLSSVVVLVFRSRLGRVQIVGMSVHSCDVIILLAVIVVI